VVGLADQNTLVTLKIIPRINLSALEEEQQANHEGRRTRKRKRSIRPLAALFNREAIEKLGGQITFKNGSGADPHSRCVFFSSSHFPWSFHCCLLCSF
jgi:hypothetical protein